jgi:hypothetical protein
MKSHPQIMPRFLTSKNSENPCPGLVLRDYLPFFTHSIRRRPSFILGLPPVVLPEVLTWAEDPQVVSLRMAFKVSL